MATTSEELRRTAAALHERVGPLPGEDRWITAAIIQLRQAATEIEELRAALERFVSAGEYTRATVSSGNHRRRYGDWVEVHAGRASSGERQLTQAIEQAKKVLGAK